MLFWLAKSPWKFYFCALFLAILFSISLGKSELVLLACQIRSRKTLHFYHTRSFWIRLGNMYIFEQGYPRTWKILLFRSLSKLCTNLKPQIEIKALEMRVETTRAKAASVKEHRLCERWEVSARIMCSNRYAFSKRLAIIRVDMVFRLFEFFIIFNVCKCRADRRNSIVTFAIMHIHTKVICSMLRMFFNRIYAI